LPELIAVRRRIWPGDLVAVVGDKKALRLSWKGCCRFNGNPILETKFEDGRRVRFFYCGGCSGACRKQVAGGLSKYHASRGINEMTIVLIFCIIFLMPLLGQAEQKSVSPPKSTTARDTERRDARQQNACHQLSEAERAELEKDLAKMRTLIEQMQLNLAATATGESPLKRQFQLDIEMWQLLVQRMEKRLEGSAQK